MFSLQAWYRLRTRSSASPGRRWRRKFYDSNLGGFVSVLKSSPVIGSIRRACNLLMDSSIDCSNIQTRLGLMRMDFKRFTCDSVSGKPSMIQPLIRQSLWRILSSTRRRMISSGIYVPFSAASCNLILMGGFLSASALRIFYGLTFTKPKASAMS